MEEVGRQAEVDGFALGNGQRSTKPGGSPAHLGQSDAHDPIDFLGPSTALLEDTNGRDQVAAHGGKRVKRSVAERVVEQGMRALESGRGQADEVEDGKTFGHGAAVMWVSDASGGLAGTYAIPFRALSSPTPNVVTMTPRLCLIRA